MAIGASSYGTLAGVGVLVPRFSGNGAFAATTRPALASVENWIDQVSAMMNGMLAQEGFAIPVADADAVNICLGFVEAEVAAMVNGVNGSGRFGPTAKEKGNKRGRYAILLDDVKAFIEGNAYGLESLGATRTNHVTSGIGYRDTDESGNETFPIFQRKGFGNTFIDWDG